MMTVDAIKTALRAVAVSALLALGAHPALADFASDLKRAAEWDVTSQRNVAYAYQRGEGVAQNAVEACAWRFIVVFARGIDVDDTDIISLEGCQEGGFLQEASKRAVGLTKTLRPRPARSIDSDISDLAADYCDGAACSDSFKQFSDLYKAAIRGETPAMEKMAECFLSADCSPAGMNGFQGCLWTLEVIRTVGDRSPDLRSNRMIHCGKSPAAKLAIEQHLKALRGLRASR